VWQRLAVTTSGCVGGNTAAFTPTPAFSYSTVSNTHLIAKGNSEQLAVSLRNRERTRMKFIKSHHENVLWGVTSCSVIKSCRRFERRNATIFTLALWWKQNFPPKGWYISARIHGVASRNTKIIVTAVRTSDVERRHLGIWVIRSKEFPLFTSVDTSCKDIRTNAVSYARRTDSSATPLRESSKLAS
jgi:hypothetical protein